MTKSGQSENFMLNLHNPDWLRRHGTAFAWTQEEQGTFANEYQAALTSRGAPPRRRRGHNLRRFIFLLICFMTAASCIVLFTLLRQLYDDQRSNLIAGLILGATGTLVLLMLASVVLARHSTVADPRWIFTTIRVGVDQGVLWIYKHHTISIFASAEAFIDVIETKQFILAFVNETAAHAFPRDKLAATEEGRKILGWFDVKWPATGKSSPPGASAPVARRKVRHRSVVLRGLITAIIIVAIIAAPDLLTDFWRRIYPPKWPSPPVAARSDGSVPPPSKGVADPAIRDLIGPRSSRLRQSYGATPG